VDLKVIGFEMCPFVQRCLIVLEEKRLRYELQTIDRNRRPDWFAGMSPMGKVPLLVVDQKVLFESGAICEYLDEISEGPRLLPSEPFLRARNRGWLDVLSSISLDTSQLRQATGVEKPANLVKTIRGKLSHLGSELIGPYFNGASFSLVDAGAAPVLQRLRWMEEGRAGLALLEGLPKINEWRQRLEERASVRQSGPGDLRENYLAYLGLSAGSA
jgi:glutathione S-transferase